MKIQLQLRPRGLNKEKKQIYSKVFLFFHVQTKNLVLSLKGQFETTGNDKVFLRSCLVITKTIFAYWTRLLLEYLLMHPYTCKSKHVLTEVFHKSKLDFGWRGQKFWSQNSLISILILLLHLFTTALVLRIAFSFANIILQFR